MLAPGINVKEGHLKVYSITYFIDFLHNPISTFSIFRSAIEFFFLLKYHINMKKKGRRVIFLDIDGVLQPHGKQDRFDHSLEQLRKDLAAKYNNDEYLQMDMYDLGAVYYDWDKDAVERLRKLCVDVPAEIVISSDWRVFSPLARLKDYFRLHDLDQFVTGVIEQLPGRNRCEEVTHYLKNNPDVIGFLIVDDDSYWRFDQHYPEQFVHTRLYFR
jgi:hypothetical protein